MSKSVRFKLSAPEEKYVIGTINALRNAGIDRGSLPDIAKSSLLEFCVGINKRAAEYNAKIAAEKEAANDTPGDPVEQETTLNDTPGDAKGSDSEGAERGAVRSDAVEEPKDAHAASEGEG